MKQISTLTLILFLSLSFLNKASAQNAVNPTDSVTMELWASSCTIPGWVNATPIYSWPGVDTVNVGTQYRISKIDLSNQAISCNIPVGLLDSLSALEEIRIRGNDFSVQGGSWLTSTHSTLNIVDISNNSFNSRVPFNQLLQHAWSMDSLVASNYIDQINVSVAAYPATILSFVKMLDVSNNKYQGQFDFTRYSNLNSSLHLQNNLFTDINVPVSNTSWPKYIDCSFNELGGTTPLKQILQHNTQLESLHARNALNNLSTPGFATLVPPNIGNAGFNTMVLDLGENNLSGIADISMFGSNVQVMIIDNNLLTGMTLTSTLNSIEILNASHNQLTVPQLDFFEKMPNIRVLQLNNNQLTGNLPVPSNAVGYPLIKLVKLDLSNNNLTRKLRLDWFLTEQQAYNTSFAYPMTIEELKFNNNRFAKILIDTMGTAPYAVLKKFEVNNNYLDFLELYKSANMFGMNYNFVSGSTFKHYTLPGASTDSLAFNYAPQKELGIGGLKRRPIGGIVSFDVEFGEPPSFLGDYNQYVWKREDLAGTVFESVSTVNYNGASVSGTTTNGNGILNSSVVLPPSTQPVGRSHLIMQNLSSGTHDGWKYQLCASNDRFPLLEVCNVPKKVVLGECFDNLGKPIRCQQFMVEIDPATTQAQLDTLKDEIGVHTLETCMCGTIELWELNDTTNAIDVEQYGTGTKSSAGNANNKAELLSADTNHDLIAGSILSGDSAPSAPSGSSNANPTIVAIIDSGTDVDHPQLSNRIWIHEADNTMDGVDDDANCVADDIHGYNFLEDSSMPYDDHGHGTNVAGIVGGLALGSVQSNSGTNDSLALLPLKFTNKQGDGTCFHAACAVRYAADYSSNNGDIVRVINASWGYYGEENITLKEQLRYAADNCDLLFVTSAGNDGTNNDMIPHYPSNFDMDNILVVAAHDSGLVNSLSTYSNFGPKTVDIVTRGQFTTTKATPTPLSESEIATGTSFATAQVTRAAALLFHEFPNASYRAVKAAIMDAAITLNSADSAKIKSGGRLSYPAARAALLANANRTACMPSLDIKLRIEGAIDTSTAMGLMHDNLVQLGVFPTTQPFNQAPWNYTGTESVNPTVAPFTGTNAVVDWVLVLVSGRDTIFAQAMLLQRDGDIVTTTGGLLPLPNLPNETYKVTIIHRNHLGIETLDYESLEFPIATFNFADTSAAAPIITSTTKNMGQWKVLVASDASADGQINAVDKNAFFRLRLGSVGYEAADYNLDGVVNGLDHRLWLLNNSVETECINCYIQAP